MQHIFVVPSKPTSSTIVVVRTKELTIFVSGALGLNGGIANVGSLYDCLGAIHRGKADDNILDVYSEVRREKWKQIIDPQSQGMLKTLFSNPEDIIPNHPMYKMSVLFEQHPQEAMRLAPVSSRTYPSEMAVKRLMDFLVRIHMHCNTTSLSISIFN